MNRILGQKISITSRKPQTTCQQILGVDTADNATIFVDTPGMHLNQGKAINQLNRAASTALIDVDAVILLLISSPGRRR